jgi:hypothetical protein
LTRLALRLNDLPLDAVIGGDWGLHQGLLSLARADRRVHYRDWWPMLGDDPVTEAGRSDYLHRDFLAGRTAAFVEYAPESGVHRDNVLDAYFDYWKGCVLSREFEPGQDGKPLLKLTIVRFDGHGCAKPVSPDDGPAAPDTPTS